MNNTIKLQNKGKALMVAHRGVSGLEKENTNAAFVAAGNRTYYGIETDVHLTADNKFILFHDDDTKRVGGVDMSIEGSNYDDIRALNLLPREGRVQRKDIFAPNMEEYFDICKFYDKYAVFELKNHMPEDKVLEIIEMIKSYDYLQNTIFISFDFENLTYVKKALPDQHCQFLCFELDEAKMQELVKWKMGLDVEYHFLTAENVKHLHDLGIDVNCWTVNDPADGQKLIEYGVDYITTNILE